MVCSRRTVDEETCFLLHTLAHYRQSGKASSLGGSLGVVSGLAGTMKYHPYGATRSVTTDKLFAGQQQEPAAVSALGLYNYGARFYSTLMGRLVSTDPLSAAPSHCLSRETGYTDR